MEESTDRSTFPRPRARKGPGLAALLLSLALGCDPATDPSGSTVGNGRLTISWRIDGAALDAARCTSEGLQYMEVDVVGQNGAVVGYTEVTCALDRYPLDKVPLGKVSVQVRGITVDARKRTCVKRVGNAATTTTNAYPDNPILVELRAQACP